MPESQATQDARERLSKFKEQLESSSGNHTAPAGILFVCVACGKTSRDRYGDVDAHLGWDESCMLNCEPFLESDLVYARDGRRVLEVKPTPESTP